MNEFQTICRADEIPEGQARAFRMGDMVVGVFHIDGEFFALDDQCPHAGASLARGSIQGHVVRCRIHHWGFCVRDGVYVDEDKPACNARRLAVRVVNGEVQVQANH